MTEKSQEENSRFSRVLKDPRFRRPAKKTSKIVVDDRFKGIFSDPKFTRPYSVDKYGRKVETKKASKKEMEKFYRLESEEDSEGIDTDASIEDDFSTAEDEASGSEDSGSESGDETETEAEAVLEDAFAQHPLVNTNVVLGDATRRLAIVNVDWDQLKAVDLFVLVSAFKPPMGLVKSVKIYPSDFGKERIAKESVEGPPKDIFAATNILESSGSADESDDSTCDPLKDLKKARTLVEESGNFDQAALRRYQLERLRYYYAVVECDSIETAAAIYHHCDGREFETSTNTLDLRYIPDEVEFDEDELTDSATSIPKKYNAKPAMVTDALQRSNIKLTWDQDDPDRKRLTRVKHSGKIDYEEADLRAYLASDSDSENDETTDRTESKDDKIARYRALLLSKSAKGDDDVFGRKSHDDNDRLDITFASALKESESSGSESDDAEEHDRVAVFDADGNLVASVAEPEDPAESKRGKKFESKKKDEKFVLQKEWAKTKNSAGKKMHKKHSDLVDAPENDSEFKVNLDDSRFKAVYDSPAFAIDPTAPMFKKTKGMEAIIGERQKRRRDGDMEKDEKRKKRH